MVEVGVPVSMSEIVVGVSVYTPEPNPCIVRPPPTVIVVMVAMTAMIVVTTIPTIAKLRVIAAITLMIALFGIGIVGGCAGNQSNEEEGDAHHNWRYIVNNHRDSTPDW
jgi:hypothetical protein